MPAVYMTLIIDGCQRDYLMVDVQRVRGLGLWRFRLLSGIKRLRQHGFVCPIVCDFRSF
jgi:hypothetical protein